MQQALQAFIETEQLFKKEDRILLAFSGGVDSVVLAHLLWAAEYSFAMAHCNFRLREAESDGDESFTKKLAKDLDVPFYSQHFDTLSYAADHNISIQMAARDLRYRWLEELRAKNGYACIATAHHLNDSLETVLLNLTKGCGIRGLHGILPKQGRIVRPLLFATREEIENYQQEKQLPFREDSSNASDKYQRNFIRHQIIPRLREINPSLEASASETIARLRETEWIFDQAIEKYREDLVRQENDSWYLAYKKLPEEAAPTVLYELLRPFGFNGDQVQMILEKTRQPGVYFHSSSHQLLVDRETLIIRAPAEPEPREWRISADGAEMLTLAVARSSEESGGPANIKYQLLQEVPAEFPRDPNIAILDFDKLEFPLTIRYWRAGDQFQPFGMQGQHQKVKDFLTGKKINRFEKDRTMVVESAGKICWVVGWRVDERFKVDSKTQRCWRMERIAYKNTQ